MISYEFCFKHQMLRLAGEACAQCATETPQRDVVNVLEARISDLEADVLSLRRQLTELRHIVLDVQQAHNALVRDLREPRMVTIQPALFGKYCDSCEHYTMSDRPGVHCEVCDK